VKEITLGIQNLLTKVFAKDVIDPTTGEIIIEQGQTFTEEHAELFKRFNRIEFELIASAGYVVQPTLATTLLQDPCRTQDEALKEVHTKLWLGDSASLKEIKERLET